MNRKRARAWQRKMRRRRFPPWFVIGTIVLAVASGVTVSRAPDAMFVLFSPLALGGVIFGVLLRPFLHPLATISASSFSLVACYSIACLVKSDIAFQSACCALIITVGVGIGAALSLMPDMVVRMAVSFGRTCSRALRALLKFVWTRLR